MFQKGSSLLYDEAAAAVTLTLTLCNCQSWTMMMLLVLLRIPVLLEAVRVTEPAQAGRLRALDPVGRR